MRWHVACAFLALLTAGCHDSPAAPTDSPSTVRVIANVNGTFEGSFTITGCDSNDFRVCGRCCAIGGPGRMTLNGLQDGDRVVASMTWEWSPATVTATPQSPIRIKGASGTCTSDGLLWLAGPLGPGEELTVWEGRLSEDGQTLTGRFEYTSARPVGSFVTFELKGTFSLSRVGVR